MPLVRVVQDCLVLGRAFPKRETPVNVGALTASIMLREGWAVDAEPGVTHHASGKAPRIQQKVLFGAPETKR